MAQFSTLLRNRIFSVAMVAVAPIVLLSAIAIWTLGSRVDELSRDETLMYAQATRERWPDLASMTTLPPPATLGLPDGSRLWVSGPEGHVIGSGPPPSMTTATPQGNGTALVDGVPFAVLPLDDAGAYLILGLPPQRHARWVSALGEVATILAFAVFLSLCLAWFGIQHLVLSKVSKLEQAAERIRAGETGVRSGLDRQLGEFGRLGQLFDDMAAAVDTRATALQTSLQASEQRFRQMAAVVPTGIYRMDAELQLTYVNPWCAELTGRGAAELLAQGLLSCVHPDDRAWVAETFDCARLRDREVEMGECRLVRSDGQIVWVQIHDTLEVAANGRVTGRIGNVLNVTAQKRITEALRESEERFRKLARIAPVGIYRTNAHGRFTYANDTLGTILGRSKHELRGCSWREFLPDDAPDPSVGRPGGQGRGEVRLRRPDGQEIWVLVHEVVETDAHDLPIGRIGTMSDITGQITAREALQISEKRFQVALKHSPVMVVAFDRDMRCTWSFNGPASLTGRRPRDVLPHAEAESLNQMGQEVMATHGGRREEMTLTWGGIPRVFDLWFDPLIGDRDQVTGVVGAAVDMTEMRRMVTDLDAARQEAEQANESKSRFLAAASHDLRQPFQAMRLFRAALAPHLTTPAAEAVASKLDEAMTAGEELLKALLDVSTLEAGIIATKPSDFDAAAVIERLAREFQPQAEAQGLSLRHHACAIKVHSDPVLLERILRNLLHNAIRYTRSGGILVGTRRRGDHLLFQVWDTGIGIAPDHQKKVFEDFFQVGNAGRDRSRGLGLGLSVVARMARLLDHPVTLQSRPGRGTVFSISVPLTDKHRKRRAA